MNSGQLFKIALAALILSVSIHYADMLLAQGHSDVGKVALNLAFEKGRSDAKKDLESGELIYYVVGAPAPWDRLWAEILRREYKVQLRCGGCIVDSEQFQQAKGYSSVSRPAILKKFGEDIIETAEKKAQEEWKKRGTDN